MSGDGASSGSKSDNAFNITNIKAYIPVTLDMDELNYAQWKKMFEMHCITWEVDGFLDGSIVSKGPGDKNWRKRDNLVKMWIYNTISKPLLQMVMKKSETAQQLWKALDDMFQCNKDARAMQLNDDIRNITIGDLSVADYCHKLKVIFDLLENIDQPIDERTLVMHTINGLRGKFDSVATFIRLIKPLPSFLDTRAMLEMEETRLNRAPNMPTAKDSSTSHTAFFARGNTSPRNLNTNVQHLCRNFQRGYCQYGTKCRFVHAIIPPPRRNYDGRNMQRQSQQIPSQAQNQNAYGQAQYQFNAPAQFPSQAQSAAPFSAGSGYGQPAAPPGFYYHPSVAGSGFGSPAGHPVQPGPTAPQAHFASNLAANSGSAFGIHAPAPDQSTTLPQAFTNLSFNDKGASEWYMDTGATSHLTSDAGSSDPKPNTSM